MNTFNIYLIFTKIKFYVKNKVQIYRSDHRFKTLCITTHEDIFAF